MGFFLKYLNKQSKYALLMNGYLAVAVILVADFVTGPDPSFFVFYLLPIIVVSWYVSKIHGMRMALASTLAMSLHDLLFMNSASLLSIGNLLAYWGLVQRATAFIIISITVSAMKSSEEKKSAIEYQIAREVQLFLLPSTTHAMPHFNCHGFTKASTHLSGDILDFTPVSPSRLAIVVGDVCGKGIPAALLVAYLKGMMRSHVPLHTQSLGKLMQTLNSALFASTSEETFATLFIGVYDDTNRTLTYVNAGHEPPSVLRVGGMAGEPLEMHDRRGCALANPRTCCMKLERGGLILGVDPMARYTPRVCTMRLGDILICETDGVDEARNHLGELYGPERLGRAVMASQNRLPEEIYTMVMKDIEGFAGMEPQFDDMTLVIGKIL